MTTTTLVRAPLPSFRVAGKNGAARVEAFEGIAPYAYSEGKSRAATIDNLRVALGKAPSDVQVETAKREWCIGRVAARLSSTDLNSGVDDDASARLGFSRLLVTSYAAPIKDGTTAKKLRKGQLGRRTVSQHQAIRAAEQVWSQLLAELGLNSAQTQKAANAKKRAPATAGSTARGKNAQAATLATIGKPSIVKDAKGAMDHIGLQLASLLAFCNKNAGVVPSGVGIAVKAAHSNVMAAIKSAK